MKKRHAQLAIPEKPTQYCRQGYYDYQYRMRLQAHKAFDLHAAEQAFKDSVLAPMQERRAIMYDINGNRVAIGAWHNCPAGQYHKR